MKNIVAKFYIIGLVFAVGVPLQSIAADWTDADGKTYTALKSINGGGSGYIATDFVPGGTDTVKFKYKPSTVSGDDCIYCSLYSSGGYVKKQFCGFRIGSAFRVDSHDYYKSGTKIYTRQYSCNTTKPLTPGTEYTLSADYYNAAVTINGTKQELTSKDSMPKSALDWEPGSILVLLASHTTTKEDLDSDILTGLGNYATGDLYYFQLWSKEGTLSHNFMPARSDSDSEPAVGLYDTVTKKFYRATDGALTGAAKSAVTGLPVKWTGAGDGVTMSSGANWEGGNVPQEGDDLDFTIAVPNAEINADIGATFGKLWLGDGDGPVFTGSLSVTSVNDATKIHGAVSIIAYYNWNGSGANWSDAGAWTFDNAPTAWSDGVNAVFDIANATATLTADASANTVSFTQPATIAGSFTLAVPTVSVDPNVSATISAPTAGALKKIGAGTLTLGSSRSAETTLSEGTLAMASGATLDLAKLTLGTDPAKPVSLDLGGATIIADLTARMSTTVGGAAGGTVAIDNGAITNTATLRVGNGSLTLGSNADVTMNGSGTWVCVGGNNSSDESVTTKDAYLVLDGASIKESVSNPETLLGIGDFGSYPSKGTMIVKNGGSFKTDNSAYVAQGCEGHLVIDGEGSSVTAYQLVFCNAARCAQGENGYVVVTNGGTLVVNRLGYGSGKGEGYFRFDGGTLRAQTKNETLLPAHEKLHYIVGAEGGTIHNGDYNITIAKGFSGPGTINLTGSGTITFAAGVGAEGGVSVANGTTLTINGTAQSSFGSLTLAEGSTLALSGVTQSSLGAVTLEAGSTIDIATPATDVAAFAATTLNLPAEGTVTLTSGGGAFGEGLYAICKMSGVTAEAGAKFAPSIGELEPSWSVDGDTLILTVGAIDDNTWTGGANDGNLSNPANWYGDAVPMSGTATINTSGELTVGALFNPDVIVFPETCGAVTIAGENAIAGLTAITNLSVSTCTFEVPVAFADKIDVHQTAYYYTDGSSTGDSHEQAGGHVRFVGGVTGTGFAEGTTHSLDGAYTIPATAGWVANTQNNVWTLPDATAAGGSSLTITGSSHDVPGTTDTSMLLMGSGCAFTTGVVRTSNRLSYRIYGEYVVTNELEVALTSDTSIAQRYSSGGKYKFAKLTLSDSGTGDGYIFWLANSTTREGAAKHVYIGAGGVSINAAENKNTALSCGTHASDVTHLYPWHSDYAINGKGGSTRDLIIFRATNLYTDDENGVPRTVTLNGVADVRAALTVKGRGKLQVNSNGMNGEGSRIGSVTVAESATLAYASGADLGAGAVTVGASATLEVASGVNTFGGGLTLNDGATLSFNFTQRTVTPQIAIANGKTLTVSGAVKVKIPADSKWPTAGKKVLTTCGGFNAEGVTVSLITEGAPKWAKNVDVNADGNIVLDVKPMGTRVIVR